MYQAIRPFISKEWASQLGFSENEMTGKDGIVVTNPSDFTDSELDFFRRMLVDKPEQVPSSIKEFIKKLDFE